MLEHLRCPPEREPMTPTPSLLPHKRTGSALSVLFGLMHALTSRWHQWVWKP